MDFEDLEGVGGRVHLRDHNGALIELQTGIGLRCLVDREISSRLGGVPDRVHEVEIHHVLVDGAHDVAGSIDAIHARDPVGAIVRYHPIPRLRHHAVLEGDDLELQVRRDAGAGCAVRDNAHDVEGVLCQNRRGAQRDHCAEQQADY